MSQMQFDKYTNGKQTNIVLGVLTVVIVSNAVVFIRINRQFCGG